MSSPHTVRSLAAHVGGTLLGAGADVIVTGINTPRSARPRDLSFLGNARYGGLPPESRAPVILVTAQDAPRFAFTRIVVDSPSHAFAKISELFAPPPVRDEPGVHPTAVVAPDAVL